MARRSPILETRLPVLAVLIAMILANSTVTMSTAPEPTPPAWPLDADGDGIDDALLATLEAEPEGSVLVEVHYDRRPTDEDVRLLEQTYGARVEYVFSNWDSLLAELPRSSVHAIPQAPGVWGVESVPPAWLDLSVSNAAVRARAFPIIEDGIDHNLAAHETLDLRGEGVVIAIMDTGVDTTHRHLDDMDDDPLTLDPKIVTKIDPLTGGPRIGGVDTTKIPMLDCIDPVDDHGHGTHVAGTALGTGGSPTAQLRGIAPQAKLVDVKVLRGLLGGSSGVSIGYDWILSYNAGTSCFGDPGEHRIDIVSMSISLGTNDPNAAINRKITDVVRSGITVVISAGNAGPGSTTITKGPEGAILVANANDRNSVSRADDVLSGSSSRGPRPADGDADTNDEKMPHIAAPGTAIIAADAHSLTGTTSYSGTSMSAPHIAGTAALILQADPTLRPMGHADWRQMGDPGAVPVRDVLIQTAQYKTDSGSTPPQQVGPGMFGLDWNNAWGYGLVDAYAAATLAGAS